MQLCSICNTSRTRARLFSFCNTSRARAPIPTGSKPNRVLARKNKGFAVRNTLSLQNGYHFDSEVELDTLGVSFCIRVQSHDATFVSEAESKGEQRSNTKRLHGGQTKQEDEVIRNGLECSCMMHDFNKFGWRVGFVSEATFINVSTM